MQTAAARTLATAQAEFMAAYWSGCQQLRHVDRARQRRGEQPERRARSEPMCAREARRSSDVATRCNGACCTGVAGSETRSSGRRSDPFRAPPLVGAQRVSGIHSQRRHLRRRRRRHRRRTQGGRRREALELVLPPAWREDGRARRIRAGGRRRHLAAYRQRRRIAERAINQRRAASIRQHYKCVGGSCDLCLTTQIAPCVCASAPVFVRERVSA